VVLDLRQAGHSDDADETGVPHHERKGAAMCGVQQRVDQLTRRTFRSTQASFVAAVPGRAAWKRIWSPRRTSTTTRKASARAASSSASPRAIASSFVSRGRTSSASSAASCSSGG
jgi:hypothetical protein